MTGKLIPYESLTARNTGYIPPAAQEKLRSLRVLIAGCGVGSSFAEVAVRMGLERITLADADTVSESNLNRQLFVAGDVGQPKVSALAKRLRAINPGALIKEFNKYLNKENVAELVADADLVFDTIDFLDLRGIVALHDETHCQKKSIISAFSAGWGGACVYFPPNSSCTFRDVFGLPKTGSVDHIHYSEPFARVVEKLSSKLDPQVISVVKGALSVFKDGKPCPTPQVGPGAFAVGSLAGTLLYRLAAGLPVQPAPAMLMVDMTAPLLSSGISIL